MIWKIDIILYLEYFVIPRLLYLRDFNMLEQGFSTISFLLIC
jgi:hypothetical protein